MNTFILWISCFLLSDIISSFLIPYMIIWCKKRKMLAANMNQLDSLKNIDIARLGGLGAFLSFIISILLTLVLRNIFNLDSITLAKLYPMILSGTLAAFVGYIDDVLIFTHRPVKPLLGIIAAIPMASVAFEQSSLYINIPIVGKIYMGLLFPLVFVPLLISFTINAFNIMADFDGLAPGNGIIMTVTLIIVYSFNSKPTSMFILITLLPVLVVLWKYNRYPSKLFVGNSGTLFIGAILGVSAIGANRELPLLILFIPYMFHFILQCRYAFDQKKFLARPCERGIPQKDGTIKSEYTKAYGLTHLIMQRFDKVTEKKLVYILMLIELFFAVIVITMEWSHIYTSSFIKSLLKFFLKY